jgi:hypothetical protein
LLYLIFYRLAGWAFLFCFQVKKEIKKPLVDCDLHMHWESIFLDYLFLKRHYNRPQLFIIHKKINYIIFIRCSLHILLPPMTCFWHNKWSWFLVVVLGYNSCIIPLVRFLRDWTSVRNLWIGLSTSESLLSCWLLQSFSYEYIPCNIAYFEHSNLGLHWRRALHR